MKTIKEYKFNFLLKYRIFHYIYLLFYILEFFFFIKKNKALPNLEFPKSITLLDGNIFIIHKYGINIYSSSLNELIDNITDFDEDFLISDNDKFNKITISRFNETNNGYIISLINDIIYVFNYKGKMLYNNNNTRIEKLKNGKYFTLIPIRKNNEELDYMIGFSENAAKINILFYNYNINTKKHNIIKELTLTKDNLKNLFNIKEYDPVIKDDLFTCSLMKNYTEEKIVCFVPINGKDKYIFNIFISINNYSEVISDKSNFLNYNFSGYFDIKYIKSEASFDKKKCLICFYYNNYYGFCSIYSIENNSFSNITNYYLKCMGQYEAIYLDYIRETEKFLFYCILDINNITMIMFEKDFEHFKSYSFAPLDNGYLKGFSIIYSYALNNYYVISTKLEKQSSMKFGNISEIGNVISPIHNITDYINSLKTTEITNSINTITTYIKSTYFDTDVISNSKTIILEIPDESIKNLTKDNIMEKISSIIEDIDIGNVYQKKCDDFSILIYPTNSTYLTLMTHVNFTECENILRKHYKIPDSEMMTFLQIELENNNSKSLINQVEYQAFDGNKTLLNLSLCENVNIQIIYSIKNKSLIDIDSVNYFKQNGIDIFNIKSISFMT